MSTNGRVSSNDVVLLHRLAMSRLRSLLGVCNLLRGLAATDETYESLWEITRKLKDVETALQDICCYDAPIRAEGIF